MQPDASVAITGCLLAGGEGRRMNGQDKGLLLYQGRPMADWVLQALAAQTSTLMVSANRHAPAYAELLRQHHPEPPGQLNAPGIWPDDADLPPFSGPLAGILTALRRCQTDWLLAVPCDVPHIPIDLAARLMAEVASSGSDIVVPRTFSSQGEERLHWVCALIHKRVCPQTEALFVTGERKMGNWVRAFRWAGVSFPDEAAFTNMNTLETLHGRA
jgi:molybdopterin-guanine dinucleotide biosynthesis protein A